MFGCMAVEAMVEPMGSLLAGGERRGSRLYIIQSYSEARIAAPDRRNQN